MRYLGLACIALIPNIFVAGHLGERGAAEPWRCLAKGVPEDGVCSEPIEDVVQVDAQVYTTKLRCKDCPHSALGSDHDSEVLRSDHDLVYTHPTLTRFHAVAHHTPAFQYITLTQRPRYLTQRPSDLS